MKSLIKYFDQEPILFVYILPNQPEFEMKDRLFRGKEIVFNFQREK